MATKTLEDSVVAWLATQGYRLEYLTHKALQDAGLGAQLGVFIEDEGKQREVDVLGSAARDSEVSRIMGFNAVTGSMYHTHSTEQLCACILCECKYSVQHPWVILGSRSHNDVGTMWECIPQSSELIGRSSLVTQAERILSASWHFTP